MNVFFTENALELENWYYKDEFRDVYQPLALYFKSWVELYRKHIKLCFTTPNFSDWVDDHKIESAEDSYA